MTRKAATFDMSELAKDLGMEMTINGLRSFQIRFFIVRMLLILVSLIAPIHIETRVEE